MTPASPSEGIAPRRATPFRRVLVANRGEIALRIIRTARALGYGTVAVHSTVDAGAPHVAAADRSVCIGEASPQSSYLNIAAIIDAARRTGADAVHPGYGFLSENADFAQACVDAGLVFIGPAAKTIAEMGDKSRAKNRMQALGVPCLHGYDGALQDDATLVREADRIGYPVMIKASAGGGGKGMRLAGSSEAFVSALSGARSEAKRAFGDDRVLLERAVIGARHVELQLVADRHGNVVHLGERDCSVQRRNQKLIEETPSPALGDVQRERLAAVSVKAVEAMTYEGVGTLEFLLDVDGSFWFMEMNTRLQVEHGVTEAVTGLDLVELQLRVAAGEPLGLKQADVRFDGHSIEARLCTEEPARGFAPHGGEVLMWRPAAGVRVETALCDGVRIGVEYDSLAAKLVAHGRTRAEAVRKLAAALDRTVLLGVVTNRAFLARCLRHPAFVAGAATTGFIEAHANELFDQGEGRSRLDAIAILMRVLEDRPACASGPAFAHLQRMPLTVALSIDTRCVTARITVESASTVRIETADRTHRLEATRAASGALLVACGDIATGALAARAADASLWMHVDGVTMHVIDAHAVRGAAEVASGARDAGRVVAAMDGKVIRVEVAPGSPVEAGQPLLSLEAMKMEHLYTAPVAGRVAAVHVGPGATVTRGQVLLELASSPSVGD